MSIINKFHLSESVKFMKENISDNFVDLTITSPPYDDLRKYKGFIFDYKSMLSELYRVTKPGGIVVWVVGDKTVNGSETLTSFKHAFCAKETGFNVHDTMIYAKNNPVPQNHNRYEQQFEYMFVFSKGKPKTVNLIQEEKLYFDKRKSKAFHRREEVKEGFEMGFSNHERQTKNKYNIWFYTVGGGHVTKDKIAYKHPALFPEKLAEDHIVTWSNPNDVVLDPMCGAGTTCKIAYLNNRNFIGIDMSEEYINEICIPRLTEYGWSA